MPTPQPNKPQPHILFVTHRPKLFRPWEKIFAAKGLITTQLTIKADTKLTKQPFADVNWVIEWLPGRKGEKRAKLVALEAVLPEKALILSSAHEVMATTMASWLSKPERLVGFSPLGLMDNNASTMEFALAMQAAEGIQAKVNAFCESLDITPHWIEDTPGMVLPRIYAMLANEAAFALQEKVATAADIDKAMCLGTNYPIGPLAWADKVGVDIVMAILDNLWSVYREERYRPCLLIQKMVTAGHLGKKVGQGFFHYEGNPFNKKETVAVS